MQLVYILNVCYTFIIKVSKIKLHWVLRCTQKEERRWDHNHLSLLSKYLNHALPLNHLLAAPSPFVLGSMSSSIMKSNPARNIKKKKKHMNVRKKKKIRNKLEALNINQGKTHPSNQHGRMIEFTLPIPYWLWTS